MVQGTAGRTQELYERYGRALYAFCLHRLGNREEAEDALQSTYLNVFRALQSGVMPYAEGPWLYAIAQNVCLTSRRAAFRRRRVEAPVSPGEEIASPEHDAGAAMDVTGALRILPASQRRALLLREWQGLSYGEIASDLGVTHSAVETLLFRARRSLRAAA